MQNIKTLSKISLAFFLVLLTYFFYLGISTSMQGIFEGDSLAYHIPIAQEIFKLNFSPPDILIGLGYYPAVGESILALFIFLELPINLFGVLGLFLLFFSAKKAAEVFGISKDLSIIYGVSLASLPSVLRWPLTQTVDIWVLVFFLTTLYFLIEKDKKDKHYFLLGLSSSALVGSKFTGLFFFLILIFLFGKDKLIKLKLKSVLFFAVPFLVFGLSWYIRNFALTGNPFYPANFFFLQGDKNFPDIASGNWSVFANIINSPGFIYRLTEAWFSEFFIWGLSLALPVYLIIKKKGSEILNRLSVAFALIFTVFLFFPPAEPVISNMRYVYPAVALLILQAFIFFGNKKAVQLGSFAILATAFSVTSLDYHPKLIILALTAVFYFLFK
jgi:hypothetical protein